MFKITQGDLKNKIYGEESYLSNWPMLYILENGKQAYIGQSNHVKTRMDEHLKNREKQIFCCLENLLCLQSVVREI